MVTVKFAHICDTAFLSMGQKLNLIGIFSNIFSKTFPVAQPCFSVVVSFVVSGMKGTKPLIFKIVSNSDKQIGDKMEVNLPIKDKDEHVNFIANFVNVLFPESGDYKINIYFDGDLIDTLPLTLTKV
ncbi:MAG: hypothetical protein A3B90_02300 [Candidatus Magasanikbacteria bacterium RIFCSPHIGHO2_02_FULL_41_13]|uniref:Uncharacterized protein n=1 Tax=Candidatus Magasanikbacteria bacterium RIFCSPHIGHO2_02_FULL_41_13 TaxID=1798676 RepID=A0A1F6M3V8_9BACT|nr:MAG: hypothetical protein A3B90_02300 [Candidatus Magasanikbacteria bacterium RIFCSPHIGHO2_02_FULL_41_13]